MGEKTFTATDGVSRVTYTWTVADDGSVTKFEAAAPTEPVVSDLLTNQTRYALGADGTKFLLEFGSVGAPPKAVQVEAIKHEAAAADDTPTFTMKVSDAEFEALIAKFGKDLTDLSRQGRLDPVIGRDTEVDLALTVLLQRGRSNVAILGEAGVGKTAMFAAVAHAFAEDRVMGRLKGGRVVEIDISAMAAGGGKQELEGRLQPLVQGIAERNEAGQIPPIVLCIDEIHNHLSADSMGAAETLKPYLTSGDLLVLGATTREEYDKYIRKDEALDRRFQKVAIEAPSNEETVTILKGLAGKFADFHKLEISEEVIRTVVHLADKYMSKARQQPDKSLSMLDAACAQAIKAGETGALRDEHVRMAVAAETGISTEAVD